jgi:hypothetical protein
MLGPFSCLENAGRDINEQNAGRDISEQNAGIINEL